MKFLIALSLCAPILGTAQMLNTPCAAPLTKGVYDYYQFHQTDNIYLDFRSYTNTQTFEDDVKKGQWALGGYGMIEGIPVGGNITHDTNARHQFVQSVRNLTDIKFRRFTDVMITRVTVNNEAYKDFVDCMHSQKVRVSSSLSHNQTDLIFNVECWSNKPTDKFPTITHIYAVGAEEDILPDVKDGDEYPGPFSVKAKRKDRFQTVTLWVVTSDGTASAEVTGDPTDNLAANERFIDLFTELQKMGKDGYKARSLDYDSVRKQWVCTLDRIPGKQFEYQKIEMQEPPVAWKRACIEQGYEVFVQRIMTYGSYWRKGLAVRQTP